MNNKFHQNIFPDVFDIKIPSIDHHFNISDVKEHEYSNQDHYINKNQHQYLNHDKRTQHQVMGDLSFSIEDLLSKITRVRQQCQVAPALQKMPQKKQQLRSFKNSYLSASTETNSNKSRSDQYIQKYQHDSRIGKKHGNSHKMEVLTNSQKNVKIVLPQQGSAIKYSEFKNQQKTFQNKNYAHYQVKNQPNYSAKSQTYYDLKNEPVSSQAFGAKSQSKYQFRNYEHNKVFQVKVQSKYQFKNHDTIAEFGVKSQSKREYQNHEPVFQAKINLHQYEIKKEPAYSFKSDFSYQTKSQQEKQKKYEKQEKIFPNFQIKKQNHFQVKYDDKSETKSQPAQIHRIQAKKQLRNETRKQIKNLLNPFQNSSFGKSDQSMKKNQKKSFAIQDSMLISPFGQSSQQQWKYQQMQIPGSEQKKVKSLFDANSIRQVAASKIFDSPQRQQKTVAKTYNPFLQIVGKNDTISQSIIQKPAQKLQNHPTIKINGIQKSQIIRQQAKLTIGDFELGKQLGSGKFGDVYQAIHKKTGALFAIKKIFKSTILEYNMIEQFTRQLKIHYALSYPNIIKLYTHFDDQYHIFLVMEYGEGGMLMEKLKSGQKFGSIIVEQMLRAVDYMQTKKIAHRDIKPENIVMMFGDTAKLCDFGWSRVFDSEMKKTFCGTLDYVSPQMKDVGEYSLKIDIWSLGVLTFQIICGFAPFKNQITSWKNKGGNLNQKWNWNILYPPQVTSVAQSFMRNLLKENPNQRANIRFCLNHLFIRKYNKILFNEEQELRFKEFSQILKEDL